MEQHHIELIRQAIQLAQHNIKHALGGPFGAIIAKDGVEIASGCNSVTTGNDPTAHAEIMAIRSACQTLNTWDLKGYELYTSCEPCPMCLGAAYWAGVSKIWFSANREDASLVGFDDSDMYRELSKPIEQRTMKMSALIPDEGRALLEQWLKKPDRVEY
ncbi:nucleoside deaminase [Alkalimarinus alittae]|uniref:Nucleoside deaminase n=1 Tax=Alkalimarinus alittae TaxID=2961619 RepID=A0ABY6N1L4_9ALTE|nr:nucleoside deaminase [Alkalimarinus alittae]UZE95949.1 nucleoside deaminase [Alkalimarinus alittae]